jgi:hypothetical protein
VAAPASEATGVYVYGVTLVDVPCDGATVDEGGLRAIVAEEPLEQYAPEVLEAALADPGWLETRLRRHEEVLEAVLARGPVAPFRFGTIFRTEADLRQALSRTEQRLTARLEELRGTAEWGVKAWVDGEVLSASLERPDTDTDLADMAEGRRYLLEKRLRRQTEAEANELALGRAHDAHAQLAELAVEARIEGPSGLDERKGHRLLLRTAYLLRDDCRPELERLVDELRERDAELGLDYVLSGPWPAYNFVDPGLS